MNPVLAPVVKIRIDLLIVAGDERVAPVDDLFNRPAVFHRSPFGLRIFAAKMNPIATVGRGDPRVVANRVIPVEIETQKRGNRPFRIAGKTDENIDFRIWVRCVKPNPNLFENGFSTESRWVYAPCFPPQF